LSHTGCCGYAGVALGAVRQSVDSAVRVGQGARTLRKHVFTRLTRARTFGLTKTSRWSVLAIVAFLLTHACGGGDGATEPPPPTTGISPTARAYLEQLIGIMQANSINRLTIDWPAFRTNVFAAAPRAQTSAETYPAITEALRLLGDGHSSYRTATGSVLFVPKRTCQASGGGAPPLPATIGYVRVTSFSGTAAQATAFANSIQDAIRVADRDR
jgi:hypothetical protein